MPDHEPDHAARLVLVVDNSSSAVSRIPREAHSDSSNRCHPPGTARRTRHLRTCALVAPRDIAASAMDGQRSGEKMSMPHTRDTVSRLSRSSVPSREFSAMPEFGMPRAAFPPNRKLYRSKMKVRMVAARKRTGLSQPEMAGKLGITPDAYKKAEQRGALWSDLVEAFADATNEDPLYILTGRRQEKQARRAAAAQTVKPPAEQPADQPTARAARRRA